MVPMIGRNDRESIGSAIRTKVWGEEACPEEACLDEACIEEACLEKGRLKEACVEM